MNFKTEFNPTDKAYTLRDNKVILVTILVIHINHYHNDNNKTNIFYDVKHEGKLISNISEQSLHKTKEGLLEPL